MSYQSKDNIKLSMMRHAVTHWGLAEEDFSSFDPIVELLIESCSNELFKVNNEIEASHGRILERLAALLAPEMMTNFKPSHAIAKAHPNKDRQIIGMENMQLFFQKKIASKVDGPLDTNLDLFFIPCFKTTLIDASVVAMASHRELYTVNEFVKERVATSTGTPLAPYTIHLGIKINDRLKDLDTLTFYFDWKNLLEKRVLYDSLANAKFFIGDKKIPIHQGLVHQATYDEADYIRSIQGNTQIPVLQNEMNEFYKNRFLTLNLGEVKDYLQQHKSLYPKVFDDCFNADDLSELKTSLLWIKMQLPVNFDREKTENTLMFLNCFPVMNLKPNELRYKTEGPVNIIPLYTSDNFFEVKEVTNASGKNLASAGNRSENETIGTYMLRDTSAARFDQRSAKDYIHYLVELLRDESAVFSGLGREFVSNLIKDINQNISLLEQKVKLTGNAKDRANAYLIINPFVPGDNVFIGYYTTNGESANKLRLSTRLSVYSGDILSDSAKLVSITTSGRERMNQSESIQAYKTALLTHNSIITKGDIVHYCKYELGSQLQEVNVKSGTMTGVGEKHGIIKTIDVNIKLADQYALLPEELEAISSRLRSTLELRSPMDYTYQILFSKN